MEKVLLALLRMVLEWLVALISSYLNGGAYD